jgi:hypothetical protein
MNHCRRWITDPFTERFGLNWANTRQAGYTREWPGCSLTPKELTVANSTAAPFAIRPALDKRDVAAFLKVHPKTVERLVRSGELTPITNRQEDRFAAPEIVEHRGDAVGPLLQGRQRARA